MANNVVVPHEAPSDGRKSSDPLRMITNLHWRDFIDSSWKDTNYKRRAIASLIQAVYLLELDRQENRTQENSLASNFWIPYKYKPTQILIDERDGSIFGAIFEWDRSAALSEFKPFKPIGAPRAVLALRGTLIRFPTMRRDFEDDFRFVAWESLKDSVRFKVAIDAVKSVSDTYGRRNVCIAGHSLGAGFGLQVGKELAKERINVETHLFNPPAVSLATILNIGEKAEYVWNQIKSMLPSSCEAQVSNDVDETRVVRLKRMIPRLSHLMDAVLGTGKWVPHLYVNKNDWISYFYIHTNGTREKIDDVENMNPTNEQNEAKLFVFSKEDQKFLEAHGLKQWWSSDGNIELKHDIRNSELVIMQLKSLNTGTPSQVVLFYYPQYVSLITSRINIREATDYVWNILKCVPHHVCGKVQISNDVEVTTGTGISLMGWIPQLSGLKDTGYWVCKWIPRLYVKENVGAEEKMVRKENMDCENGQITANLFTVSKEQLKFLAAHGLEQWWPNDLEFQQTKLISRHIKSLYTASPWEVIKGSNGSFLSLATCLGEKEEFIWKWNNLKSMLPSSSESRVHNDGYGSGVGLKSWIPQLSGLKDAAYWVWNWVPRLYVDKNCGTEEKEGDKVSVDPANEKITAKLRIVSKEQQRFLAAHGLKQWWPSDAELQQAIHDSKFISRRIRSLSTDTPWEVTKILNPFISLPICLDDIGQKEEFVWKWNSLNSMLPSGSESRVRNDDYSSGVGLKGWIPQLSGLKDTAYWVWNWVPRLYVNKNSGTEKEVDKVSVDPTNEKITAKLRIVSKEQQKFLAAHGLKQWWPSAAELQQAIHDSKFISRRIRSLSTDTPWEVTKILNPFISLPICVDDIGQKEEFVWKWNSLNSMLPSGSESRVRNDDYSSGVGLKGWIPQLSGLKDTAYWVWNWVPRLYVNKNSGTEKEVDKVSVDPTNEKITAKLRIVSKEQQKFLAAHGLKQWRPSAAELQQAIHDSKFISRRIRSLSTNTPWEVTKILNPFISLPICLDDIGQKEEFVWKWNSLNSMLPSGSESRVRNDDYSSGVGLKGWIPQLSGLKDTAYWVWNWVPRLYVNKNSGTEKEVDKVSVDPTNEKITAKLRIVSKEQQKFLAAHGLKQWWPSDAELQQAIHDSKFISRRIRSLSTDTPWEVTKILNPFISLPICLDDIGQKEEFVWKWNSLNAMLPSGSESRVRNDYYSSGVGLKGWIPQLSGLKDTAYWVWNWVPRLYVNKNCGTEKEVDKVSVDPTNEKITAKLRIVSKEQQRFLAAHGLKQWWPSAAELQQAIHDSKLISRRIRSLSTNTPWEVTKRLNPFISLPICLDNIGQKEEFVWKWNCVKSILLSSSATQVNSDDDDNKTSSIPLKNWMPSLSGFKDGSYAVVKPVPWQLRSLSFVTPAMSLGNTEERENFVSSRETQMSNDSDKTSCVGLKSWIPSLSSLKDAAFEVGKLVPYFYANKSGGEKMVDKESKDPLQ